MSIKGADLKIEERKERIKLSKKAMLHTKGEDPGRGTQFSSFP